MQRGGSMGEREERIPEKKPKNIVRERLEQVLKEGRRTGKWYSEPLRRQPSDALTLDITYKPGGTDEKRGRALDFPEGLALGIRVGFKNKLMINNVQEYNELIRVLALDGVKTLIEEIDKMNKELGVRRVREAVDIDIV